MKIYKLIFTILIVFTLSGLVNAQGHDFKKKFGVVIDSLMKQQLVQNHGFSESTADKFIDVYEENNKQVKLIMKEKKNLMESIEQNTDAPDMDTKINKIMELETSILDKRKSFFEDLRTFLTPQQIAKTLILRKKIAREIRKEINNHKSNDKYKEKPKSE